MPLDDSKKDEILILWHGKAGVSQRLSYKKKLYSIYNNANANPFSATVYT